ncbi:MAG TPA: DUF2232 domain-containing protein [Geothermobacteraceae bacterium]|nr:DUF2232 domain-containing protein [Geothermobacteraceae bacterium]
MPKSLLSLLAAAVITLLLQSVASGAGPIGVLLNLVVPFPIVYLAMRQGLRAAGLATALVLAALLVLGGPTSLLSYLLQFGSVSLLLPALLLKSWSWDRAVVATLGLALAIATLALVIFTAQQEISLTKSIGQYVDSEIKLALNLANDSNLSIEQQDQYRAAVTSMGTFLKQTLPAWTVTVFGAMLLLQVFLLSLRAEGRYLVIGPAFSSWSVPEVMVWPLIAAGFAVAFASGVPRLLGLNLLVVFLPIYFLQGLAVVTFFFQKKQVSPMLRALGYTLIAFLNPMPMIVTAIGVFDMWADFRKPRIKKT